MQDIDYVTEYFYFNVSFNGNLFLSQFFCFIKFLNARFLENVNLLALTENLIYLQDIPK